MPAIAAGDTATASASVKRPAAELAALNDARTAVYWTIDEPEEVDWSERVRGSLLKLPQAWRILYQDGNAWRPVATQDPFGIQPDQANQVCFTPVKTQALRLAIDCADAPCGIQEWVVD